jgi:putative two-component system response regulator
MPHGQAREIIERSRGTHLDPDVVDAFLADFDGFCRIASRHADTAEDLAAKRR